LSKLNFILDEFEVKEKKDIPLTEERIIQVRLFHGVNTIVAFNNISDAAFSAGDYVILDKHTGLIKKSESRDTYPPFGICLNNVDGKYKGVK
jgi:hypothetical protein